MGAKIEPKFKRTILMHFRVSKDEKKRILKNAKGDRTFAHFARRTLAK